MGSFPYLSLAILFPVTAAFLIPLLPDPGDGSRIRWVCPHRLLGGLPRHGGGFYQRLRPHRGRSACVTFKPRLFHVLMLAMCGGQGAVFAVQDVLLFFLAWELELIPVYLLLAMGFQGDGDPPGFAYGDIAAKPLGPAFQVLCYSGLLVAFGVKLPVVPLHTSGCRQSVQSIILNVRPCGSFTDQVPSCWRPSNSSIRRVEVRD